MNPAVELATHYWLQNHSGLGELIGYDYEGMSLENVEKRNIEIKRRIKVLVMIMMVKFYQK